MNGRKEKEENFLIFVSLKLDDTTFKKTTTTTTTTIE